eukprot:56743-Chlamydomonas_euryale.AAC.5
MLQTGREHQGPGVPTCFWILLIALLPSFVLNMNAPSELPVMTSAMSSIAFTRASYRSRGRDLAGGEIVVMGLAHALGRRMRSFNLLICIV